jgi:hypothetical protein
MKVLRPILAAGFLGLLAGPVLAQDRYATLDVRAGYTFATGAADSLLKSQSSFGASANIALAQRLHLGLSVDWANMSQKDAAGNTVGGPNDLQWKVLSALLKVGFDLVQTEKFTLGVNAGGGTVVFSPNEVLKSTTGVKNDAHFAVNGGATVTYWFADRIGIIGSAQANMALKKSSGQIFTDKSATFFPITGGFSFKL